MSSRLCTCVLSYRHQRFEAEEAAYGLGAGDGDAGQVATVMAAEIDETGLAVDGDGVGDKASTSGEGPPASFEQARPGDTATEEQGVGARGQAGKGVRGFAVHHL
jgi:hypothetical protein